MVSRPPKEGFGTDRRMGGGEGHTREKNLNGTSGKSLQDMGVFEDL